MNEMDNGNVILREIIQQQHVSQQLLSCAVNEVSGLPDTVPVMQLDALDDNLPRGRSCGT